MIYQIGNQYLKVSISSIGAELQSIQTPDGREWLWQGDPAYWEQRAPIPFPFIGKNTIGIYHHKGKAYPAELHGFAHHSEMNVECYEKERIVFSLHSNVKSLAIYPFRFCLEIEYSIQQNKLEVSYRVKNLDRETMYFEIAGHPGFNLPLDADMDFSSYQLRFPKAAKVTRFDFKNGFPTGKALPYPLDHQKAVQLDHNLFYNEAVILAGTGGEVQLFANEGHRCITMCYPQMPIFAFWHPANKPAPFLCLEPWSALPSRYGVIEQLSETPYIIALAPGKNYCNAWNICFTS